MNIYDSEQEDEGVAALTFEQYKEYKESCEQLLGLAQKAAKLSENPEFKEIIMDVYFDQEPKRLAGMMATGRLSEKQFADCADDLRSIGSLRAFLQDFIQKGNIAQGELENLEAAWNEAVTADAVEVGDAS